MRKNCSSDGEKLLKFEAEGQEFSNFLRSLEQFIQTVKIFENSWPSASNFKNVSPSLEQFFLTLGQNNFDNKIPEIPFCINLRLSQVINI